MSRMMPTGPSAITKLCRSTYRQHLPGWTLTQQICTKYSHPRVVRRRSDARAANKALCGTSLRDQCLFMARYSFMQKIHGFLTAGVNVVLSPHCRWAMPFGYGAAPPAAAALATAGQQPLRSHDVLQSAFLPTAAAFPWSGAAVVHGPPPLSRVLVRQPEASRAADAGWGACPRHGRAEPRLQLAHASSGDSLSSARVHAGVDSSPMVRQRPNETYNGHDQTARRHL